MAISHPRPASYLRIAVLHHAATTPANIQGYSIALLTTLWRQAGHEVIHLSGLRSYVPADLVLVHVDLSVTPESYLDQAARYPVGLNTRITDIRKSQISQNLLHAQDTYQGPVIVKSNLNHAGIPERHAFKKKMRWPPWKKRPNHTRFIKPLNYPIYDSITDVPSDYWDDPFLVMEKFFPERADGFYFLRESWFLGDRHYSWRMRSSTPIIRANTILEEKAIPTPQEVDDYRRKLGLDYGKIDFVEHDGKIMILDVNKTIGDPSARITLNHLAPAIQSCTSERASSSVILSGEKSG